MSISVHFAGRDYPAITYTMGERAPIRLARRERKPISMKLEHVVRLTPDEYEGEYVAVPSLEEQTFRTKFKSLTENFRVTEIPHHEVHNEFGTTFVVG